MEKIDVIVQSYKKPESLIYTLLTLKKYSGDHIDCIYIDDDISDDDTVKYYLKDEFLELMKPIQIKIRVNEKKSGYTHTCMTWEAFKKKKFLNKIQLLMHVFIKRIKFYRSSDDIRYQWGINSTDKKYVLLIHDDIKFNGDIVKLYLETFEKKSYVIVGDLGGLRLCPFGPCGEKCSPSKILSNQLPSKKWPITGKKTLIHTLLGRYDRNCRINEWCCMLDVSVCKEFEKKYGVYFGNYEGGGDVGSYWLWIAVKNNYKFCDPLPFFEGRKKYYEHPWQGNEGHQVWVAGNGLDKVLYKRELIINKIEAEYGLKIFDEKVK